MTAELVRKAKAEGERRVKAVVGKLAHEVPELAELDAATLEKIARLSMIDEVKGKMKKAAELERIPYQAERERFIARSSKTGSERTKALYSGALDRLEAWCGRQSIEVLELTPAKADDWIESEKAEGKAPSSVRLKVSGASAFFSWLERRHAEIHNPFRGTRARPANKPWRKLSVPTEKEVKLLIEAAKKPELRAAIVAMSAIGLRVGALPSLSITGARWSATTKGKEQSGSVPDEVREAITAAGLPLRSPFGGTTAVLIAKAFAYHVRKLFEAGKMNARFSVHDLRHAFAVKTYGETRDVYAVKRALGHQSVSVTETYLRSLDVLES
jgi:site-specific recombinase XerD